jgi:Ni/Co efflux regulator RcnB
MKRVVGTLAVMSIVAGSAAMADPHFEGGHDRDGRSHHRDWQQDGQWNQNDDRRPDRRDFDHRDHWQHDRGRDFDRYRGFDRDARPYGWHGFRRGERLPTAYYSRSYVIENYRGCGLYAPPRGYRWVRVDRDAVLAAFATGIVLDAVYHAF